MIVGALLPVWDSRGSIRRVVEIGNNFKNMGHEFYIENTRSAKPIDRKVYKIHPEIKDNLSNCEHIFFMSPYCKERAIRYWEESGKKIKIWVYFTSSVAAKKIGEIPPDWSLLSNNLSIIKKKYPNAIYLPGGVSDGFFPRRRIRVGFHARKGRCIARGLKVLDHIELVPIRGVETDEELINTYQSLDFFVSHETVSGWSNMCAEALACGTAVVSWKGINCEAFSDKIIETDNISAFFKDPMAGLRYSDVAKKLESIFESSYGHLR